MRVVHVATYGAEGGAARGVGALHRSLLDRGVDSWLVTSEPRGDHERHIGAGARRSGRHWANRNLERLLTGGRERTWSLNLVPSEIPGVVRALKPDLVNVHWVGAGGLTPGQLSAFGAPLVWTLRDMWPITGGCHYDEGCGRFETGCGRCPQIRSSFRMDASSLGFVQKRWALRSVPQLVGVALSKWLAARARSSPLWGDRRIDVIPPGVDVETFRPQPAGLARRTFDLPLDGALIGFVALHPYDEPRKGWAPLKAALEQVRRDSPDRDVTLVVTGDAPAEPTGLPVIAVGRIDDPEKLRSLYAACDVVAAPSLQEAFGKVALEALASGTPVTTFAGTGPADVIEHGRTGYIATHADVSDLARGLEWALGDGPTVGPWEMHREVGRVHSLPVRARQYQSLYGDLLT